MTKLVYTVDGGVYEVSPFTKIGIDVVSALALLKKVPQIADETTFDCIRPHVNLMLGHIYGKEAI